MIKRIKRLPLALGLSLFFLVAAIALPAPRLAEMVSFDSDIISQSLQMTVRIVMPIDGKDGTSSTGSGSIIDPSGYILTNFHVVGDMESRTLYNEKGLMYLLITPSAKQPPKPLFIGQVVRADANLDLALIKVIANIDGTAIKQTLRLPYYELGTVDDITIGDTIGIIGYPGIGRGTVTFTQGDVSGFTFFEDSYDIEWIKTEALMSYGNSGGTAIALNGRLVGVPTQINTAQGGSGTMGYIRPVDLVPGEWLGRQQQQKVAPEPDGVVYKGQILDAKSGRGIEGAVFAFFPPGEDIRTTDEDPIAVGVADADGNFITDPPVPLGTYPLLVGARGYSPLIVEYEVKEGSALRSFSKPIVLQRR